MAQTEQFACIFRHPCSFSPSYLLPTVPPKVLPPINGPEPQAVPEGKLVPTNTTSTATYAAVAASTSFPSTVVAKIAMTRAKRNVADGHGHETGARRGVKGHDEDGTDESRAAEQSEYQARCECFLLSSKKPSRLIELAEANVTDCLVNDLLHVRFAVAQVIQGQPDSRPK